MYIKHALLGSVSWRPNYAPDMETGTEEPQTSQPINERAVDGPGSGRSDIRKSLEKGFEDDRKATKQAEKDPQSGKFTARDKRPSVNHQVEEPEQAEAAEVEPEVREEPEQQEEVLQTQAASAAPTAWPKEAKAEWEKLPPAVQAAVTKRETDTTKGVEALKRRYGELDQVLQPRAEMLKRTGHTEAQAVNQLFSWFEALNQDTIRLRNGQPPIAFTALAQSFGLDPAKMWGTPQQQQPVQQQEVKQEPRAEEQPVGNIDPAVQQYINGLQQKYSQLEQAVTQKFGALENTFAEQSFAKTNDILSNWAKDKPYFEEVRGMMAHLVGSGAVAPQANGSADLDRAYDMALYALPEVRAKVLAEQEAKRAADVTAKANKEKAAQQAAADKARRTNVSLTSGSPGSAAKPGQAVKKGKSVKESIAQAMEELRE